jgi:hypothetical protein
MIHAPNQNKYGFNMQVSAQTIGGTGRNRLTSGSAQRRQILRHDINRLAACSIGENAARCVGQADEAVASQSS